MLRQLHCIIEHVHYCYHGMYLLVVVGSRFVVSLGECLRVWMGPSTQPIWLQFDVDHWLVPIVMHPHIVHSPVHFSHNALVVHLETCICASFNIV
jgi:hypothetical protein